MENIFDSFSEYQDGQFDDLWDEYLDWIGLYASRRVGPDSLEDWLAGYAEVSELAASLMRGFVYEYEA